MTGFFVWGFRPLFLSFLSMACLVMMTGHAAAQSTGCKPEVLAAQTAMANARRAASVAATAQIVPRPDSVLAMTCFNQAASVSAKSGGAIFSGDFTPGLASTVTDALSSFYGQYADAVGFDTTTIDYGATSLTATTFDCGTSSGTGMNQLYTNTKSSGVTPGVPYVTVDDLRGASTPAMTAASNYEIEWNAAMTATGQNLSADLDTALTSVLPPCVPSYGSGASVSSIITTSSTLCP